MKTFNSHAYVNICRNYGISFIYSGLPTRPLHLLPLAISVFTSSRRSTDPGRYLLHPLMTYNQCMECFVDVAKVPFKRVRKIHPYLLTRSPSTAQRFWLKWRSLSCCSMRWIISNEYLNIVYNVFRRLLLKELRSSTVGDLLKICWRFIEEKVTWRFKFNVPDKVGEISAQQVVENGIISRVIY